MAFLAGCFATRRSDGVPCGLLRNSTIHSLPTDLELRSYEVTPKPDEVRPGSWVVLWLNLFGDVPMLSVTAMTTESVRRVTRLTTLFMSIILVLSVAVPAGAASANEGFAESEFLRLINQRRAELSLAPLAQYWDLVDDAREHSRFQSEDRCSGGERICHNPALGSVTTGWYALGENVGVGFDVNGLDRAFWNSPTHQANVVGNYNYAGVGAVVRGDGALYVTVVFMRGPEGLAAAAPGAGPDHQFPAGADQPGLHNGLRGTWSLHGENSDFYYGVPSDVPVTCDWDGDQTSTVGLYRNSTGYLYLRNLNDFGVADVAIFYGIPEDVPVCGDWNGDGVETIGIFRPSEARFYLRNSNSLGFADIEFRFGRSGDIPLAGDWYGQGHDSVAVYRPSTGAVYLADGRERLGNVVALPVSGLLPGDQVIAGDWDADGTDTLGTYRPDTGTFSLRTGLDPNSETVTITYGPTDRTAVAGVW